MSPSILSSDEPEIQFKRRMVDSVSFYVRESVISSICNHADEGLFSDSEVMGLIIGSIYRDDLGHYAVAERVIVSPLLSDRVSVKFDKNSMNQLIDEIDLMEDGERIVGWYHSHLGCGCFMSETDISTQDKLFGGNLGFALVIDPVLGELKVFDSTIGNPSKVDMLIMED